MSRRMEVGREKKEGGCQSQPPLPHADPSFALITPTHTFPCPPEGMMELTGSLPRAMTELCLLETSGRSLEQELGHVLAQVRRGGGGGLGGGLGEGGGGG